LINVRERAGYLDERARCQSCGYLEETGITCATGDGVSNMNGAPRAATNGAGKISLSREDLVELLSQAVNLKG
jgi:hypothetical protein